MAKTFLLIAIKLFHYEYSRLVLFDGIKNVFKPSREGCVDKQTFQNREPIALAALRSRYSLENRQPCKRRLPFDYPEAS